jgi:hypothetical protein
MRQRTWVHVIAAAVILLMIVSGCKSGVTNSDGSPLSSIAVTVTDPILAPGATRQFIATGTYGDHSTQDLTSQVAWDSSDTTKATIDANGLAAGLAQGTTSIRASLAYVNSSVTVTVIEALQVVAVQPGSLDDGSYLSLPANGIAKVQFNHDIDTATLNNNTFEILDGVGAVLDGTISYDAATKSAIFTFPGLLPGGAWYSIVVSTGARDVHGGMLAVPYTWSFFNGDGTTDVDPPVVLGSNPSSNDVDVSLSAPIYITFNEPVDIIGLTNANILVADQNNESVPGTFSSSYVYVDPNYTLLLRAVFTPAVPFEKKTLYTVNVQGVKDYAGNAMTSPYTYSFTTLPIAAPTNLIASQTSGTQVTLSWWPVDGAESYNLYWSTTPGVTKNGTQVSGVTSPYTITLPSDNTYYIVVTAVNGLGEGPVSNEVTPVVDTTPPTVTAVTPNDGATGVALNRGACVRFSEFVNGWNETNVSVIDDNNNAPVAISLYHDLEGDSICAPTPGYGLYPINSSGSRDVFKYDTTYTITITNIADAYGNIMAQFSWSFTTQSMAAAQ